MRTMNHIKFIGADHPEKGSDVTLMGVPFDGTSAFRPGSRFGPDFVRVWSDVLETYSPVFDRDLEDLRIADAGNVGNTAAAGWQAVSEAITEAVDRIITLGSRPLVIGGEHLVTFPAVEACLKAHPDLVVVHMDAHLDLRDEYDGNRYTHATVMKRILEKVGNSCLIQFGVRSGTRDEWRLATREDTIVQSTTSLSRDLEGRPVYLSVDLDVLDPSIMPETGTPEPGGLTFLQLHEAIISLRGLDVVGADVVEYCPFPGGGGPSGAVAAKVIRELIFLISSGI
jgi:agmatinase